MALLETVGVMGLVFTLLSLCALVLNQAFVAHRASLSHFHRTEQLERLADRLRRDAHAATDMVASEASLVLQLSSERQAIYRLEAAQAIVTRDVTVAGQAVSHERWTLPLEGRIEWSVDRNSSRPLITTRLRFEPPTRQPSIEWVAVGMEVADGSTQ